MVKKAPRRTAQRILETTLGLFNRFGEPNVSTTLISSELSISPGNLYYHFPAKDELVNALFDAFQQKLHPLLGAAPHVSDIEEAWFFMHSLFELIWEPPPRARNQRHPVAQNQRLSLAASRPLTRGTPAHPKRKSRDVCHSNGGDAHLVAQF